MALGLSVVQINSLMDYLIAYLFVRKDGEPIGPAVLGYAQYLYQLPLGVFGIALATAIFPFLSKKAAEGDEAGLAETVQRGVRMGLFIALPATVGLMVVAQPLVRSLYERGEFSSSDTPRVASTVMFYSLGMTAYFAQHVVVRSFYALHDSRTPARVASWMVVVNFVMNLCLVFVMEERGLALATAVCAAIQVVWLGRRLERTLPVLSWSHTVRPAGKMVLATAAMGAALQISYLMPPVRAAFYNHPLLELFSQVALGVGIYAAAARLLRIPEWHVLQRMRNADSTESSSSSLPI
jgi:putative peptidoglycan lipid II flippase